MERYFTEGVCSRMIEYEVEEGILKSVRFLGGCRGNTEGISRLAVGRPVGEVVTLLKGVQCRNGTSCPDQLSKALEQYIGDKGL